MIFFLCALLQFAKLKTNIILYCLQYGSRLGWFIDPEDTSVLTFLSGQQPELIQGEHYLPVLPEIEINLTVNQVFSWLKMGI
ncbi:hypothetical protein WDZ92_33575 [Nostoc sp. NIES-2111]